jgi:hypothetical protein
LTGPDPVAVDRDWVADRIVLPVAEEPRRGWYAEQVVSAHATVAGFAAGHGWASCVRPFFERVEVHADQHALWARLRTVFGLPADASMPTAGLAGALEQGVLLVVTPEVYARVEPRYGAAPGAYARLLAHEIAHRLHIAVLEGDEDRMGPAWFYEGFAVVASGDLVGLEVATADDLWHHVSAAGGGAYAHYAAALRFLAERIPLPLLVARAGDADFEDWVDASAGVGRKVDRERGCPLGPPWTPT